ncbi:DUF222 domain-containing protein [Cellulomonas hominis]
MPGTSSALRSGAPPARKLTGRTVGSPAVLDDLGTGGLALSTDQAAAEPLEMLRGRVEACAVAALHLADTPGVDRLAALGVLDTAITRLTSARAALLVAERETGAWRAGGAASFAQWRGRAAGVGPGVAAREERQAHALTSLPTVADSANSGDIALAHVDVIARVASDRSEKVRAAAASPQGQAELVSLARGQDAATFARTASRWAARQDADALEDAHQGQRRRRFLHLATTDQGTRLSGLLDNQAGYRLRLALEAASPRPAQDDDRSNEQRAADALSTLAEHVLADPGTQPGAAVRPHVSFVMREETWTALRRRRAPSSTAGPTGPRELDPSGVAPSDTARSDDDVSSMVRSGPAAPGGVAADSVLMEDGTPVPRSEVEQALCDCELTRIVTDAADVPVNLGRTQRLYTGPMRRAVISRDHSCRWPGCHHPARWCEIHHIRWWDRHGGDTSLTNGVLLCPYHHHEVHRRDLTITRLTPPPPSTRPRAQARERRPSGGDGAGDGPGGSQAATGHDTQTEAPAHLDPLGAARYRFTDPTGRLVAGPGRTPTEATDDGPAGVTARPAGAPTGGQVGGPVGGPTGDAMTGRHTPGQHPPTTAPTLEASTLWADDDARTATKPRHADPPHRGQSPPRAEPAHNGGPPGQRRRAQTRA